MVKRRPGSQDFQAWRSFLKNQAQALWSCDFFVQPSIGVRVLYILVIMELSSRKVIHFNATDHPTLDWNERHLRRVLAEFIGWYNHGRVHQGLNGIPDPDTALAEPKPVGGRLVQSMF